MATRPCLRAGTRLPALHLAPLAVVLLAVRAPAQTAVDAASRFERVRQELAAAIGAEMQRCALPGLAIAVADGETVVWAAGFGSDASGAPLRGNSPFPVASISKLVTATAAMRAVERGALDLDADVQALTPGVRPTGFDGSPITLRQLLTHAGGVVREPPAGHYFDLRPPPLADVVSSLGRTALVAAPGAICKYSNAGVAWAGHVLARCAGAPFETIVGRDVLVPLGLGHATFAPAGGDLDGVVRGTMWTYDRRAIPTPHVGLGLSPATNWCASMSDLVRFAQSWFLGARRVPWAGLRDESLRAMFTPQRQDAPIGLAFFLDRLEGHLRVGHDGAYYGVASQVAALPEAGVAVAVATPVDFAAGPLSRLVDAAMRGVLAARAEQAFTATALPGPVGRDRARALAGGYGAGVARVDLLARGDELWLRPTSGPWCRLAAANAAGPLVIADRVSAGDVVEVETGSSGSSEALRYRGARLERMPDAPPPECPEGLLPYLGEYGWEHGVAVVGERDGHLTLLVEWLEEYPLEAVDDGRFALPRDRGLYRGEEVWFERDAQGAVVALVLGAVRFARRPLLGVDGGVFRITPRFPRERLLAMAKAARAPRPAADARPFDLVELQDLDPSIRYDVRYASADNFMGFPLYERAEAKLQRPAAEALVRVHRALAARGLGLLVHDAYRPWLVTKMFFDATPDAQRHFVADPTRGSRHNRGCAVDLGLYDLASGEAVAMPSVYDEFTPRAYPDYPGGTSRQRYHRELLRAAMEAEGFAVYEFEWWHFDYRDWERYPVK